MVKIKGVIMKRWLVFSLALLVSGFASAHNMEQDNATYFSMLIGDSRDGKTFQTMMDKWRYLCPKDQISDEPCRKNGQVVFVIELEQYSTTPFEPLTKVATCYLNSSKNTTLEWHFKTMTCRGEAGSAFDSVKYIAKSTPPTMFGDVYRYFECVEGCTDHIARRLEFRFVDAECRNELHSVTANVKMTH
ncbi:hypothetical protein [Limnobacter sp.]|uniref:hypothetical protein n=1 Tax=Limnobacter sp. TaxID=2003368 RepID=UPI00258A0CA2|nr:hypothetical protein [Limnobacter sp.]